MLKMNRLRWRPLGSATTLCPRWVDHMPLEGEMKRSWEEEKEWKETVPFSTWHIVSVDLEEVTKIPYFLQSLQMGSWENWQKSGQEKCPFLNASYHIQTYCRWISTHIFTTTSWNDRQLKGLTSSQDWGWFSELLIYKDGGALRKLNK